MRPIFRGISGKPIVGDIEDAAKEQNGTKESAGSADIDSQYIKSRTTQETSMHLALVVALGSISVAPFIGRWRANLWLKQNLRTVPTVHNNVVEIA